MLSRVKSGILMLFILVAILPQVLNASITVGFGETVSGSIDFAGEVDTYAFSAVAGDTILVRMSRVSGNLWPEIRLYSPNGTELGGDDGIDVAEVNCTLAESGEHTISAYDSWGDQTGNYSVFLQRLNNPGNAVHIEFGERISGSIDPAGNVDSYTFSANVNDTVFVRMSRVSGSIWPELRLYSPNGTELERDYSYGIIEINCILAEDGNYTVLALDNWGDCTGNFSIFFQRLNNPLNATSIEFGKTVSASIDPADDIDSYILSAEAGDTIFLRTSRLSGSLYPEMRLYAPNGTELLRHSAPAFLPAAEINCTVAQNGNYSVLALDHFGDYIGNYSIFAQRLNNPSNAAHIVFAEVASGSFDPAGEVDTYILSATAGDTILVRMSPISGVLYPEVRLYSPNGAELGRHRDDYGYELAEVQHTLAEDGNYTILAYDYWVGATGNYSLFVLRLNDPSNAVSIRFGETVFGSIDPAGEVDAYVFSAVSGDTVLIRMSVASPNLFPEVRLYSPNGTELRRVHSMSSDVTEVYCILVEDGNYTILVNDFWGNNIGNYSAFVQRLNNPGNAVLIRFGETISGTIDSVGDVDTYIFAASASNTVCVRMSRSSGFLHQEVRLYAPDGTELGRDLGGPWDVAELNCTLVNDGNYTVLACDQYGYTGNYTLSLSEIIFEELTLGNPYVSNISEGEWHSFQVNVEADRNLLIALEPSSPTGILELYGRYAQFSTQSAYDYLAKKRNIRGNYELLISPTENGTYYLGVLGRDVEGVQGYSITASLVSRHISDTYPRILANSTRATVHISGIGFTSGMQVRLQNGSASSISAETVVLLSSKMVIAHFNLSHASLGIYDIAIIWPDSLEEVFQSAVEISELREGALYFLPEFQMEEGTTFTFDIVVPDIPNLFVTLQKTTLVSYGDSWSGELSLMREGIEVSSASGSHDLILHIVDPNPGVYTVKVTALEAGSGVLNVWASLPELPLGDWVVGTIYTSYGSIWYHVEVPPEQDSLVFEAEAMGAWSHFDIYYEECGSPDHWVSRQGTQTSVEISNPAAGTYIVEFMDSAMLYSDSQWSEDQTRDVLIRADTTFSVEPPPSYLPHITSISTNRGGNTGLVTVEIKGGWLDPNATVSLTRSGCEDIVAQFVDGNSKGTALAATFNLTNREPGECHLVVTNRDGRKATAQSPFTIEESGEPKLWVDIIGREKIRVERDQKYIVAYGNLGNVDSGCALILIRVPEGVVCKTVNDVPLIEPRDGRDPDFPILVWVENVKPNEKIYLPITLYAFEEHSDIEVGILGMPGELFYDLVDFVYEKVVEHGRPAEREEVMQYLKNRLMERTKGCLVEYAVSKTLEYFIPVVGQILLVKDCMMSFMRFIEATTKLAILYVCRALLVVNSATPEDKYGPTGFDSPSTLPKERRRFVPADQKFYYQVDFWNKENATAPACDVFVKDQLDTDLDWSTFRFEEIGFLNWTVELEPCQYFNVYVDTRPQRYLIVNVEGTFDSDTGEISWTFRSLDPATMETPEDPMAGFLPPITKSGYEVGWVCFSVNPKADLPTGTLVENQAFVNFDGVGPYNPAPKEGPFVNTIDSAAPTSWVKPLLETQDSSSFILEWEGDDGDESGIRDYTIYVSENGESFVPLLEHVTETSTVFNGEHGHTYYFFACSRDNVGNAEIISYEPEATTTIMLAPQFTISNLTISPAEVQTGENVTISLLVSNNGSAEGTYEIMLKINGTLENTQQITLVSGASQNITFTVSRSTPGNYIVEVNGLTGEFTVKAVPEDSRLLIVVLGATIVIGAILVVAILKKRKTYAKKSHAADMR